MQHYTILRLTEAVMKSDSASNVYLVQGPPGTGKTSLIVGLIVQLLYVSNTT